MSNPVPKTNPAAPSTWIHQYGAWVTRHAVPILAAFAVLVAAALYAARGFYLDASSESLLLETDRDLALYREIAARFGSQEFVFITCTPQAGDAFAPETLDLLGQMRADLQALPAVRQVHTLLDIPLLRSPPVPLADVIDNIKTLETPGVDHRLARTEILESEVYGEQMISRDGRTTSLLITLEDNPELDALRRQRNLVLALQAKGEASAEQARWLDEVRPQYVQLQRDANRRQHELIVAVRGVLDRYRGRADIRLGGVPMVADDMIEYVRSDLRVFGISIVACIVVTLAAFFRRLRWLILAALCCGVSIIFMFGFLGLVGWPVTVISANFVSILLIITMSLVIHLIVQYLEIVRQDPARAVREVVVQTVALKWTPALFCSLTTIAGFSSLVFCNIKPVKDFGLMMCMGLVIAHTVSFLLFPALLALFPRTTASGGIDVGGRLTRVMAGVIERRGGWIVLATVLAIALIVLGVNRLTVENSFINNFHRSTEIYRGMTFIDQAFGGTTPLDVLVRIPQAAADNAPAAAAPAAADAADDLAGFEEYDEPEDSATYWYTPERLDLARRAHACLEQTPHVGKVLSIETLMREVAKLNGGKRLEGFELAILIQKLPPFVRDLLVTPYVSAEENQLRLTARVRDSDPDLRRQPLLDQLRTDLDAALALPAGSLAVNGVTVLYSNMLRSLYRSQILTIGITFLILLVMFLVLFRSFKLSLIVLFPNLIASLSVLAIIGLAGLPLDLMTITIASISIGIAVDGTIHYLCRFRQEFAANGRYLAAMRACHDTVGRAMSLTSITIILGFSILTLSKFVPTVLFGALTGVAMVMAWLGALGLMPWIILRLRPFGPEPAAHGQGPSSAPHDAAR